MQTGRRSVRPNQISPACPQDVDAGQVEMPGCLQHVAVVGIDLTKAVLPGAGQVQGVTGSQKDRGREVENGPAGSFQQVRRHP
jgi:hypothetical protein